MLLDCLGRHPALYAFPSETRLIPYLMAQRGQLRRPERSTPISSASGTRCEISRCFARRTATCPDSAAPEWRYRPRSLAAILDAVFGYFAARDGKRRWCEKTPQHVQHLLALAQQFPTRKIYPRRPGWPRLRRVLPSPLAAPARTDDLSLEESGRCRSRAGPATRRRPLPGDPLRGSHGAARRSRCARSALSSICPSTRPCWNRRGRTCRPATRVAQRGLQQQLREMAELLSAHRCSSGWSASPAGRLAECGYETSLPACGRQRAGLASAATGRRAESLRQYGREIWRKLNGDLERPWRVILAKPFNALRQRQHNEY